MPTSHRFIPDLSADEISAIQTSGHGGEGMDRG